MVACAVIAAAVTWVITPAAAGPVKPAAAYTATATPPRGGGSDEESISLDRDALYVTTGQIPARAA